MPHAVLNFMEIVDRWSGGAFFRNAGHVLQVMVEGEQPRGTLAWQEYSPDFPHYEYTLGYAGRPGGSQFYISIMDNVQNHGPASQGSAHEADSCFAKVIGDKGVVNRLKHKWGTREAGFKPDEMGFMADNDAFAKIDFQYHIND